MNKSLTLFALASLSTIADTTITPGGGLTNWEMFVTGGASVFFDIFTALKMFTDSSAFSSLALTVASLGFLVLMIKNVAQIKPHEIMIYFVAIFAASYMTFNAKVNLTIIDTVGTNRAAMDTTRVVTDVPASVGLPAAWISSIGEVFLNSIETYFSFPTGDYEKLKYQNTRTLNMEARLIQDGLKAHPFPPLLTKSLSYFYKDCVFPLIANGELSLDSLMKAQDLPSVISGGALNPALSTTNFAGGNAQGDLMGCKDAWDNNDVVLKEDGTVKHACLDVDCGTTETVNKGYKHQIETYTKTVIQPQFKFSKNVGAVDASAQSTANFGTLLTAVMSNVQNASDTTNASTLVKNRSLTRAFNAGLLSSGASAGFEGGSLPGFLIEEQTTATQTEGWRMAITAFNNMAGYIFTVLHAFIIAISPLVLVLLFMPGVASKMVLNYLQVLFWLTLWQPMMALVNYIIISFQNNELAATFRRGSSEAVNFASAEAWRPTTDIIDKYTLAAGFLGTMVPMISWGLVKGGMAFSQFIASGIGTSVAQGAAKNLATGTVSMDNKSFGNTSGNKFNTMDSIQTGQAVGSYGQTFGNANNIQFDAGATSTAVSGDAKNVTNQMMMKMADTKSLNYANNYIETASKQKTTAAQEMYTQLRNAQSQLSDARSRGDSDSITKLSNEVTQLTDNLTSTLGLENSESITASLQAQGKQNMVALAASYGANLFLNERDSERGQEFLNGDIKKKDIMGDMQKRYDNDEDYRNNVNASLDLANAGNPNYNREDAWKEYKSDSAEKIQALSQRDEKNSGAIGKKMASAIGADAAYKAATAAAGADKGVLDFVPGVQSTSKAAAAAMKSLQPTFDVNGTDSLNISDSIKEQYVVARGDAAAQVDSVAAMAKRDQQWATMIADSDVFSTGHSIAKSGSVVDTDAFNQVRSESRAYQHQVTSSREHASSTNWSEQLTPEEASALYQQFEEISGDRTDLSQWMDQPGFTSDDVNSLGGNAPNNAEFNGSQGTGADVSDTPQQGRKRLATGQTVVDGKETDAQTVETRLDNDNTSSEVGGKLTESQNERFGDLIEMEEKLHAHAMKTGEVYERQESDDFVDALGTDVTSSFRSGTETLRDENGFIKDKGSMDDLRTTGMAITELDEPFEVNGFSASKVVTKKDGDDVSSQFIFEKGGNEYTWDAENDVMVRYPDTNGETDAFIVTGQGGQAEEMWERHGQTLQGEGVYRNVATGDLTNETAMKEFNSEEGASVIHATSEGTKIITTDPENPMTVQQIENSLLEQSQNPSAQSTIDNVSTEVSQEAQISNIDNLAKTGDVVEFGRVAEHIAQHGTDSDKEALSEWAQMPHSDVNTQAMASMANFHLGKTKGE